MQYLLLIHNKANTAIPAAEWQEFFAKAIDSKMFRGGSAIKPHLVLGNSNVEKLADRLGGFMRFDTEDKSALLQLLETHPIVKHGGTVELCEMPAD